MTPGFLPAASAAVCFSVGLYFFRFYVSIRERLFLWLALAGWTLTVHWIIVGTTGVSECDRRVLALRAAALLFVIGGFVDRRLQRMQ